MFNSLRENLNNLVRADRPESPTDAVFIFLSMVVSALVIYAAQVRVTIHDYSVPHFSELLAFVVACKTVKVWSDKSQAKSDVTAVATVMEVPVADTGTPKS